MTIPTSLSKIERKTYTLCFDRDGNPCEVPENLRPLLFDFCAQVERDVMFELLAKNGPMEVSPDGEIRKVEG